MPTAPSVLLHSPLAHSAERKYPIVEKEALACVWAVERWRTFLGGRRFTLQMDHQALTTLLATKGIGRAGMSIARLAYSAFTMKYLASQDLKM